MKSEKSMGWKTFLEELTGFVGSKTNRLSPASACGLSLARRKLLYKVHSSHTLILCRKIPSGRAAERQVVRCQTNEIGANAEQTLSTDFGCIDTNSFCDREA